MTLSVMTLRQNAPAIPKPLKGVRFNSPTIAVDMWENTIGSNEIYEPCREHVIIILLDGKLHYRGWMLISKGGTNSAPCEVREVMRSILCSGSNAFVLMHNHPSGDVTPSRADYAATQSIAEACKIMDLRMLDHIIVGSDGEGKHYSFEENHEMPR